MKFYILLPFLFLLSCKNSDKKKPKEFGSLTGNIYWKYNNFVGNKPDAGSDVTIYSTTDSTLKFEATADVRGDYRIDSLPVGLYLIIIKSENTRASAADNLDEISMNAHALGTIFHTDLSPIFKSPDYQKKKKYDSLSNDAIMNIKNPTSALEKRAQYEDSSNKIADKIIDRLPDDVRLWTGLFGTGAKKVKCELVYIEPKKTETIVTDFGITYF